MVKSSFQDLLPNQPSVRSSDQTQTNKFCKMSALNNRLRCRLFVTLPQLDRSLAPSIILFLLQLLQIRILPLCVPPADTAPASPIEAK